MSDQTETKTKVRRQVALTCAEQIQANSDGNIGDIAHFIEDALEAVDADFRAKLATLEAERDAANSQLEEWDSALAEYSDYEGDDAPWDTMHNEFTRRDEQIKALSAEVQKLRDALESMEE